MDLTFLVHTARKGNERRTSCKIVGRVGRVFRCASCRGDTQGEGLQGWAEDDAARPEAVCSEAAASGPGPEQVTLAAEVNVPGSWFTWDESSRAERQEYYRAVALEFEERHVFDPAARGKPAKLDAAISLLLLSRRSYVSGLGAGGYCVLHTDTRG